MMVKLAAGQGQKSHAIMILRISVKTGHAVNVVHVLKNTEMYTLNDSYFICFSFSPSETISMFFAKLFMCQLGKGQGILQQCYTSSTMIMV